MAKQKILVVHNYYKIPGGEDTVVKNEIELLKENGHEVILYSRHNDEIDKKNIFKKIILPLESIFSIRTYKDIKNIIKREKIDVVHVHNTLQLISPSVYYAAVNSKVPVLQTVHNFRLLCPAGTLYRENRVCEDCIEKGLSCAIKNRCYRGSLMQSIVMTLNIKFHRIIGTYKKINGYIALTDFNKQKLKVSLDEQKIFIKPNFVNQDNIKKEVEIEKRDGFLYVGRIDKLKGIQVLLKAWKDIKDEKLYIVGTGPYEEDAKKYVDNNSMNNVVFLGFKNKKDVMDIIEKSKALIIPSQWYEGFPMTIVESFHQGTPVIGSDIGNIPLVVNHQYNGLIFQPSSSEDLRAKVNELKDKELLKKLAINARKDYEEKYSDSPNYKRLKEIYDEVK